jgi:hypothetical protein
LRVAGEALVAGEPVVTGDAADMWLTVPDRTVYCLGVRQTCLAN